MFRKQPHTNLKVTIRANNDAFILLKDIHRLVVALGTRAEVDRHIATYRTLFRFLYIRRLLHDGDVILFGAVSWLTLSYGAR